MHTPTLKQLAEVSDTLHKQGLANLEWSHNEIHNFWWFHDNSNPMVHFKTKTELKGYIRAYLQFHFPQHLPASTEPL